jgi:phi13 family phage major tail protein
MSEENRSAIGLDSIYVAEVLEDSATAYTNDTAEYFAPAMEASSQPAVNRKTQYADDQPYDALVSEGETTIALTITGLAPEMMAKVTGCEFDATTGRVYDNGGTAPYYALGFRSKKTNGSYRYYWFLKGRFDKPAEDYATESDSPDPKPTKLNFTAIKTVYEFDLGSINDGAKRVWGDEDTTDFDGSSWFVQVQTPGVAAPAALALSSSVPVDGTSSINKSADITLTFNNVLKLGSEYNVVLIASVAKTVFATVNSIDTARKVITLNPTGDLAGTTIYIVAIGVADIYGQTLATEVDFTTAA